jgi:hypothetical protein
MSYALITGASKGIGKAIAEELAKRNIDVLLIARNETLLQQVAATLSEQYHIKANYLSIDLTQTNAANAILDWCNKNNYAIHILINNAGYGLSGAFDKYSLQEQLDNMQVNMTVPVQLTSLFLPSLKLQPKSYILNIASSAAYQAVPGLSLYAASKSFILNFSRGLNYELRKTNISVTVVSPGSTDTDFAHRANVGIKALKTAEKVNMQPTEVAKIAIDAMFAQKKEIITGLINQLGAFLVWLLPKTLSEKVAASIYDL